MSEREGRSPIATALITLLVVGAGWYFFSRYDVEGWDQLSVTAKVRDPDGDAAAASDAVADESGTRFVSLDGRVGEPLAAIPISRPFRGAQSGRAAGDRRSPGGRIPATNLKIATWALDGLGPTKLSRDFTLNHLVKVLRQFDIVAVQQVGVTEKDILPRLVEALNGDSRRYDFLIGRPTGPEDRPERLAFLFDATRVEVDRSQTYEVDDPQRVLTYRPLVGWFRAAAPPPERAWTFTVVNARMDLGQAASEVRHLAPLIKAVREDGRGEDDVIIAGLFHTDAASLVSTMGSSSVTAVVTGQPTDVRGRRQSSNILLDRHRTTEYVGRGGVFDFLRAFNLDLAEAESVSGQLPVYGEFTATEVGEF